MRPLLRRLSVGLSISSMALTAFTVGAAEQTTATGGPTTWLNLIEGFFSKFARSVLRHIRVESKEEVKNRIMAAMDYFNQEPIVHTWSYKLDRAK